MDREKIAILTETGGDIPLELMKEKNIELLPIYIHTKDTSYVDRVELSSEKLYEILKTEIPKTSMPSTGEILEIFKRLEEEGYNKFVVITISSALSGYSNMVKMALKENGYSEEDYTVVDTKHIGLASGMIVLEAAEMREKGMSFSEIKEELKNAPEWTKEFFSLETLKFLIAGGRLGKVQGYFGELLQIKPIISCGPDGVYYNAAKVRGQKRSYRKICDLVREFADGKSEYALAFCYGGDRSHIDEVKEMMADMIDGAKYVLEGEISASLGVHTGPGLFGIAVYAR